MMNSKKLISKIIALIVDGNIKKPTTNITKPKDLGILLFITEM